MLFRKVCFVTLAMLALSLVTVGADDSAQVYKVNPTDSLPAAADLGTASAGISSQTQNAVCLGCHMEIAATPPSGSHLELECLSCHQPHNKEQQNTVELGLKACTAVCHGQHDLGVSHPMGDELFYKTGVTLTCTSVCHSVHLPGASHLLRAEGSAVCKGCHEENF